MKILIDLDDVICDCGFLHVVNKFLNTQYKISDFKDFYIQDIIPENKKKEFHDFFFNNNMYDLVKINDNAIEVIEYLNQKFDVYICSAYVVKDDYERSGILALYKYNWLFNSIPFIDPNKYIFTSSKNLIDADIKIDDRLSNLEGKAKLKILYTAYHNTDITDQILKEKNIVRANNWLEVKKIIDDFID